MAEYFDYKSDPITGNLVIDAVTGDFAIAESTGQELKEILISNPGEWRQNPEVGVSLNEWLNAPYVPEQIVSFKRRLKQQIENDGMKENQTQLGGWSKIRIDAERQ